MYKSGPIQKKHYGEHEKSGHIAIELSINDAHYT